MVFDEEYIIQTVKQILQTKVGEWSYDEEEGIDRNSMLGKDFNEEEVKDNILAGLLQIDDSFEIVVFECTQDKMTRKLNVKFSAQYGEDNRIDIEL